MDWFTAVIHWLPSGVFRFHPRQAFSHGFSFEFDVMGIVYESVEGGFCEGGVFHSLVPSFDGHLAGNDVGRRGFRSDPVVGSD